MRLGIIGGGSIGSRHVRNAMLLGHQSVLYDVRPASHELLAGAIRGVTFVRSMEEAVTSVDAVLLCTPAATHAPVAEAILSAGYVGPLFVEKPLATTLAECAAFLVWPSEVTMVGYNHRFHCLAEMARDSGPVGGDLRISCDMKTWPGSAYAAPMLECSHELDLALWLGAPRIPTEYRPHAAGGQMALGPWTVDVDAGRTVYERAWSFECRDRRFGQIVRRPDTMDSDETYMKELQHFLACAAAGTPTRTPFVDGAQVLRVLAAAERLAP